MPFLLSGPIVFVDDEELRPCIAEFSERVRRDKALRPALDHVVGNRWADGEETALNLVHTTLFRDGRPNVSADWLARATRALRYEDVDRLAEIFVDCAMEAFPLHSAAGVSEIASELAVTLKGIVNSDGLQRQRLLLSAYARLSAGALLAGL